MYTCQPVVVCSLLGTARVSAASSIPTAFLRRRNHGRKRLPLSGRPFSACRLRCLRVQRPRAVRGAGHVEIPDLGGFAISFRLRRAFPLCRTECEYRRHSSHSRLDGLRQCWKGSRSGRRPACEQATRDRRPRHIWRQRGRENQIQLSSV